MEEKLESQFFINIYCFPSVVRRMFPKVITISGFSSEYVIEFCLQASPTSVLCGPHAF